MTGSNQTAPLSESQYIYPDDDVTRLSYDSLAYSEVTGEPRGMSIVSSESLRLNGYLQDGSSFLLSTRTDARPSALKKSNMYRPSPSIRRVDERSEWFHHPQVRLCYFLSASFALSTVLVLTSGVLDTEWLQNLYLIGARGMRAQGIADASLIKTQTDGPAFRFGSHGELLKGAGDPDNGCESTIMLIRHCEKGDLRSHCNYDGFERAAFLAEQFGNDKERWPAPSQIYALKPGGRGHKARTFNFRETETVQFLADKLDLQVDETYDTYERNKLARKLLESILSGDQCGKLTLVSWKHSDIAKLAHVLGKSGLNLLLQLIARIVSSALVFVYG